MLYEPCTYAPTERLQQLREGITPLTFRDVQELWSTFREGTASAGTPEEGIFETLVDFGMWLSGKGYFEDCEPAEVVW